MMSPSNFTLLALLASFGGRVGADDVSPIERVITMMSDLQTQVLKR